MIKKELGRRNLAASIYLVGLLALIVRTKLMGQDAEDAIGTALTLITSFSLIAACAFYLRAKRRSLWWLALIPTNVIALVIYYCLNDRTEVPDEPRCSACGAANIPGESQCRLCRAALTL